MNSVSFTNKNVFNKKIFDHFVNVSFELWGSCNALLHNKHRSVNSIKRNVKPNRTQIQT